MKQQKLQFGSWIIFSINTIRASTTLLLFFTAVSVFKCNLTLQLDRLCARSYSTAITVRNNDLHTGMNCLDE